ncbi:hypothetical protein KIW84_UN0106 [Lathyrus oleraceus]|nr:hypothetical protein KIW84_UN0106 [Pisum sativum]
MRKDDPKLSILFSGPSRLADEMLGLGGTPGGVPLAALEGVSLVAPDGVPLAALEGVSLVAPDDVPFAALEGVSLVAPDGVPLAAHVSVSLTAPDGVTPPPNDFLLVAPVGVPPPPDDIRHPPPDESPLTAPDGVPPPPPPNDLPLVASSDLHLRTLMAQRQQRAAPFVFTPQLELDLKRGVYRHNSHSKKWTRIIADEDFRFPPDTKTEVLRQKWRRMRKDDPKLSILLSGPSRLADEMLGLGGTPGGVPLAALEGVSLVAPDGVPLAALEGVSLVAPDGVPLAAPVSVSLAAPDGVTPPPNGFPLVAPVGVPPPPDDIRPPPPDGSPLTAPDGVPPPPPPNDLPLVASDDLHLRTLMAQRQQRAAPFVFTPQLELDLKRGVYRHNSHSKKWTRIIADEDFRFPPDTKTEVLRQKWRRMRKDDPKLSILLSGPSRLADEMLGLGGTPGGVPLAALEGVSLVAPDGVPLAALEGVSLVAPDGVPLAAPVSVSLAAPDGVTPPPNGFPLVAPVGVPPPPDDIRPPPPDGSPLTAPDGVPPPPPPNDLPLVASDDLHLRTLMAQRQQRAAPFVFTPQLELDLKRGVYRHNSHSKKWTRIIADEDFRFPPDTKTEVLRQKWRRMRKDDPKLSILLSGPSRLADEMLGLGGTPGGVPLAALEGVSLVAPDGVPLAALEGVSLVAPDGVPLAAPVSVSLAAPDGVTPPPNGFPLVAPVGVPPPPDDIRPPPPDGSPLTAPDGVPPPPPPNDLPLVASDDLHLRTLMAQRQQRAAPFVFTPQLELDLKRGVYRHNSHSKKWTRIIADEDFRFPPDTKTEVLRQKWRRMRKDDPKLSILLSGPSRLADEMLGLGGTPGGVPLAALEGVSLVAPDGVPLAALEGVSLVAPDGVPLAAPVSVSLAAPDGVTPPPNGFPLVAPVGVPPPPDDIRPPPPDGSPLTAPDGVPPPPPPNDLPLVASDDLHLRTLMAQRQQRAAPFVFTPQLELDLKRGVYRHNSHSKKWTRIIADEDFRFPPDTKTEVLRQKWRRMRKDDPKLSILLSGPSRLADEMLGLGGTPGGVPLAALEGVSLVAPDGVPLAALEGVSLVAPDGVPLAAPVSVSLAAPDGVTPPPNGFPLVAPVGVPPPPDDIRPPPPDGSPLTAPDGVPPPPPPNDLPLVASDDLHLRTLMAQRQQRAAPFVFTPQLELDLKRGVYRHNSHSKKWTRIIADEDFRFPPDTKTEVLRQKWRRMRKDDQKLSILLSGPSRLADEMLGLGGTPGGVPLAALEGVSLVAPDGVPLAALEGVSLVAPDGVHLAARVSVSLAAPDGVTPPPNGFPLVAPVGVPPPPDDIRPPPPDGVPPPPSPNDLPLVASDDLHLRTLMAQRQQHAAPFVFTPQLELDLKRGVYRHNSHSKKWTRIIVDKDFRFPPDTKTEVLRSGPSCLEDEMLGLGGTPGGVPLAALEGVSLVAPDRVPLAALVSVSVTAPDRVTPPPNGFPLVAPVSAPPPPDDIRPPPPDGSPLTAPDGVPPPPPPNDLPLVASDDLHLRTLMAQRQQRAAPFVFTPQLELDLKRGVYRHNSHSKKWTRIIADEDFRFPPDTKTEVLRQKWRRMRKDDPKLSILLSGPSRLADEMLGLGGTPGGVPLAALEGVSLVAPDGVPLAALEGVSLVAPDGVPLAAPVSVSLAAPDGVTPPPNGFPLVAPVGVPPPPDDIRPPPPDGSPLTAPDGVPPPPPPNDLPLVASDDLHLRTLMAQRQQRAAPFVFTPQLELDLKRGVYRHNSHSKKWTRIIADEDFRFPPDTKTEVLRQKWRRMRKDDPKLSILLSGPSRLADEMLGLGGTPGGVPLAALEGVSLVAPDGVPLAALEGFPLVAPVGVPPPPDDIRPPPPDGSPLTAPDGVPPPPPPNDLPLVASDDLHLRTLMAQRQQRAAPFVFTPQLELDLKRGVYRHNSHSKKWTRIIADEDFRFPPDTKTEVLRQKWRRMRKDDPKLSILLSGPSRLADEMLGLGGTPGGVPLAALEGVSLVAPDGVPLAALEGVSLVAPDGVPLAAPVSVSLAAPDGVTPPPNGFPLVAPVGVPPPPDDIRPPPPDGSPLTAPDGVPPPPPPNDLPLVASDDLHLRVGRHSRGVPLAALEGVSLVAPDGVPLAALEGVSLVAPDGVPLAAPVSVSLAAPDGVTPPPNGFPLVAPVGVPPPPDDIRPPPPDGSPLTAPDGVPPPPPPNDLPLVASDDLHLRTLMAQRQQRAAPFVFTPQLELDLKRGVYRHNSHSKKWTRIIADEDFRFPPDTKTEVLRQKWRRMRKDDPKLSILLSGPSRLADEMLGLGGTPGGVPLAALEGVSLVAPDGVPLAALEGVSLVAPDGVPLAAPVSVSLAAPDGVTPPPNGFPLVAPVGVPPPPDDIRPPPPDGSPLTAPDGVPPPPPPNDLPLVASDDLHLRTLMAQRQQRAAPFVFTPQLELDLKRGVYRHNSHSKKWTRIIADEDFRFPPDTKTEVLRQKWRRMRKDDPKLSILLSGPSRLADEMLGLGGTPGGVPLAALEGVSLVAPDGVPLAALEGVSLVAPDGVPLAAPVSVSLAAPDGVTPPPNGFPLVAPVGVPPPPDDIRPPPPDGSPLTAPDGVPPPPPPNDLPLVASDDLHLRTLMAQRQQRAAPFVFTPQLELDLKRGVYRHNSHSKKWTRIIADEDFQFPPDTKTEVLRKKWRRMRKDDLKLSILLSGPSRLADELLGLGGTPGGVPLAALEGVSLVAPDSVPLAALEGVSLVAPDGVPLAAPVSVSPAAPDGVTSPPTGFPLVAPVGVPPPPDDIHPPPPDGSPLTVPDGVPPPPPPNDIPLVASDDLHLRTLMAQRQQRAAPFVFTPQLELDLKRGVYRHNSHSKKWTRIIADEDFRFPPDTKTEVLRQKWRRMRKDDPKLSILLSGPSRLADEMLGLGGTPGGVPLAALEGVSLVAPDGVPLAALEGVSLVAPDGVPLAARVSVSLAAPDGVTPPPNGFPLVAPIGVPPPPDDIRLLLPTAVLLRLPTGTLMAQRQQRAAPFVFTPQLELDLKRGVYRHNSHSKKWTRIIADEDFRFPPDTKTEVLRQKWRRMRKDDPKLSILLSGPSRLADELLELGGTPGGVPLAALKGVSLVAPDGCFSCSSRDVTPPPNGFSLVAPVGVPPPPDDIRPPPPEDSPLTAPAGVPPPPPPNDLPLLASDDLHLSNSKKWTRIITDEDFRFPPDTKTEQKWRRMRKDDPKLSILLSGPSRLADEMLGLGGTPSGVPLAALEGVSLVAPDGVPLAALEGVSLVAPDGVPLAAPVSVSLAAPDDVTPSPNGFPLVAPIGVPPPPDDIRLLLPTAVLLRLPTGTLMAQRQQCAAPFVFTPQLELDLKRGVYRHNNHSKKWTRIIADEDFRFPPDTKTEVLRKKWRRMRKDDPKLSILLSGPSRLADEMLELGGTPGGVPLAALKGVSLVAPDGVPLAALEGVSLVAPDGVPLAALVSVSLAAPDGVIPPPNGFSLVAPVGVPPPPDDIRPPPPDDSPLTAPAGVPPPPPPNDLPLLASDDLHLSKKWTRIITDEDFRFPPDTKTEQKWRRMRKDDLKLSILLSGPSRLADEMLGLGGTPGGVPLAALEGVSLVAPDGVPLAALEGVSLVAPDGVPLAAPVSVSLAAPDDVTPSPNGFPLVAPIGVPPPPDDIRLLLPTAVLLRLPTGTLMAQRQQCAAPFVFTPQLELDLKRGVYRHNNHSKKWTRIIADEDFRYPPDTKTEVLRQKWRRMRKDDPKLSILLSGPSRLADKMLGLGGTPGGVPLAALEGVSLVAPDGVPLAALKGVSLVTPDGIPLAAPVCVSLAAPDGVTPSPNGFPLVAPVGVPPPPDDIRLFLPTILMAQRQQRATPFVFTPQLELDLKRGVYRHNSHSKKWTRIIADEDFRFPPDTKTEVLRQKWRRMPKDDPKLSILLSGPSRFADEMLGLGGTPGGVPLAALEGVSLVAPDGVPLAALGGVTLVAPDGVPLAAPVSVSLAAPDSVTPPPNSFLLVAHIVVPPPPDDIRPPPPDGSPLTAPDGVPPPPPPNDLPLVASDDLHLRTLTAQRQQRATPFVFTPQLELDLKRGVYRHNSHRKKWTRIIADEDFRFPPDTKTEVLRQKWRRMRKDDPKLSILLSGPSRLADEMLGLGGTPGGVPLADLEGVSLVAPDGVPLSALEGVTLVAPDGVPLATPVSVSLAAPDGVTPPPNDFPLVAPVRVPPPPNDIRLLLPTTILLRLPTGFLLLLFPMIFLLWLPMIFISGMSIPFPFCYFRAVNFFVVIFICLILMLNLWKSKPL